MALTPRHITGTRAGKAASLSFVEDAGFEWIRANAMLEQLSFELCDVRTLALVPVPARGLLGYDGLVSAALILGGMVVAAFGHNWQGGAACAAAGLALPLYRIARPPHALIVADATREFHMVVDHASLDTARSLIAEHGRHRAELPSATAR